MSHKDEIEVRKAALLKAARAMVRLRHSLAADEELNEVLPRIEREFTSAVNAGMLPATADILGRFLDEASE